MTGKAGRPGGNHGGGRATRSAKRHNVYLDNGVWDYLNRKNEPSKTIERLARTEMDELLAIANAMYQKLSGADSTPEKAQLVDEIYNWLRAGDGQYTLADVPDLIKEWTEYFDYKEA